MKLISSKDNPLFKELKQLASSSQARRRAGQSLLDGVHLAQAWLQYRGAPQLCVVAEGAQYHPEVAPILARSEALGAQCLVLADKLYDAISTVENGVGLFLLVMTPQAVALVHSPPAAVAQSSGLRYFHAGNAQEDWGPKWQITARWPTPPLTATIIRRMKRPMRASSRC